MKSEKNLPKGTDTHGESKKRDQWSGSFGFIMASAGSAVGLGNLWKFPYLAGKYGGGLFVLVYLITVFVFGAALILAELALGRFAGCNAIDAFGKINRKFKFVGVLGALSSFAILSFYSVVGGWILKYIFSYIFGDTGIASDPDAAFNSFVSSPVPPVLWHIAFMTLCLAIVAGGISGGIERASVVMMPALLVLLIFTAVRGMLLPGAVHGVEFYLRPDPSAFSTRAVAVAVGQVFFSLSLGMGTLVTYGSYLPKKEKLPKSAAVIAGLDTAVALLSGFAVLPAVFALGLDPQAGAPLLFITLPRVFSFTAGGRIAGAAFFILLLLAAVTSVISLAEVIITCLTEKLKMKRGSAVALCGAALYASGAFSSLSQGALSGFRLAGMSIFDFLDFVSSNILLPVGGFFLCVAVGWLWKPAGALREITADGKIKFRAAPVWSCLVKYALPVCIIFIVLESFGIFG